MQLRMHTYIVIHAHKYLITIASIINYLQLAIQLPESQGNMYVHEVQLYVHRFISKMKIYLKITKLYHIHDHKCSYTEINQPLKLNG